VEVKSKDPMAGGAQKVEILTHFEHDVREIGKAFSNQMFSFGVVGAMHVYMKINPPLLLQVVTMPMTLWDTPVFQAGGFSNKHSTDIESPPSPPPRTCMSIEPEATTCSDLVHVLVLNDPPARCTSWVKIQSRRPS